MNRLQQRELCILLQIKIADIRPSIVVAKLQPIFR